MLRNWHSYSLSPPKKRRERKIWVKPWISTRETDGAFHRLLKDLEGDPEHYSNYLRLDLATFEVFLFSLKRSPFFGDFFEVVLQATSAMFVTNYPRGYTKVGFCYSQTEKIASKSPQNSSMFEIAAILWRQIATKSP